jgi:hypothetical protein
MKVIATATALLMLSCTSGLVMAQQTPAPAAPLPSVPAADRPTEDSVRQLLQVMHAKTVLSTIAAQMDTYFDNVLKQQVANKTLSAEDQKKVDEGRARMKELMGKVLSWDTMESVYLTTYENSFSQSEIDSMIGFYGSPAGQAVIAKLPLAMQNAMGAMQGQLKELIPQIQQVAKDTATAINSEHNKADKKSAG